MAREIPEVVRAAAGLAATVLDEARKLPETLPGLPVRVIGLAMQQAMKAQQTYAGFVARGDELFTGLRGEDEPGLATFDDDEEPLPSHNGFRESAFDRADDTEPTSAGADLILAEELGEDIDEAQQSLDVLADEAPDTEAILDEIAIDELVDQAPALEETAPAPPKPAKAAKPRKKAQPAPKPSADDTLDAEPTADVATTVDVLTPAGDVTAVEATVTDEGVAAPESPADAEPTPAADAPVSTSDTSDAATATATDEGGAPVAAATGGGSDAGGTDTPAGGGEAAGSQAAGAAPVDGYDSFTVAQLRGRLRGYALSTVQELVTYEEATRARAQYLTMLRNRLEKLEEQAIEASPLAPRGA
jgi:hypothetical protein